MQFTRTNQSAWVPPFCPNPNCIYHNHSGGPWPFKKTGFFKRFTPPHRIQRFTCKSCGRSFSTQTFSTTYWQKRPDLDLLIFMKTIGCMANRQIARDLNVSPCTIDRHLARLGRHCLLFHWQMMQEATQATEIVIDGFESFEFSQYFPIHHHVAVEKESDFFIYFTDSPLRRKGRMTPEQKNRRQLLEECYGRPDPKAIEKDMQEVLEVSLRGVASAVVFSDDHHAYRRSLKHVSTRIDHRVTSGKKHRDKNNNLWPVNLLDLLIRHSSGNHKRETIAWSKRRQSSAERLAVMLVWRNYIKGRREKVRGSPTPAMAKGILSRPLQIHEILSRRLFRSQCELPPRWSQYYDRAVVTRALPHNRKHELKYAY